MALAIENRVGSGAVSNVSTISFSVTVTAGGPLVVGVVWQAGVTVTSIKWNTSETMALTQKGDSLAAVASSAIGLLKNPTTGTHNVDVVFSATLGAGGDAAAFAITTSGGDTGTGFRTVYSRNDANGTGPGITDVDSQNGDIVFHVASVFDAAIVFDAGETTTSTTLNGLSGNTHSGGLSTKPATGANTVVGCTDVAFYSELCVAVISAAAGGGLPFFMQSDLMNAGKQSLTGGLQ